MQARNLLKIIEISNLGMRAFYSLKCFWGNKKASVFKKIKDSSGLQLSIEIEFI